MAEFTRSFVTSRRPLRLALVLAAASLVLFWPALRELRALSAADDRYAYLLLIPVNSAVALYLERGRIFAGVGAGLSPRLVGLLAVFSALGGLLAWGVVRLPAESQLAIKVLFMIVVWAATFALCFGVPALRAAKFPFLLLLLMAPIPPSVMDKIVTGLQTGSADATYALFQLAGVPVFKLSLIHI